MTNAVAKEWLKKYATDQELTVVQNSGHLETWYGELIRNDMPSDITDGPGFQVCFDGCLVGQWGLLLFNVPRF